MDTVGKRLRAAREAQGYTIQQLHELTRLPEEQISGFEEDRYFPNISALGALQKPLKSSIEWLLTGIEPEINPLYSSPSYDGVRLSQVEADLIAMFRQLNNHDQGCAFDIVTMLYEQAAGNRVSPYSAHGGSSD